MYAFWLAAAGRIGNSEIIAYEIAIARSRRAVDCEGEDAVGVTVHGSRHIIFDLDRNRFTRRCPKRETGCSIALQGRTELGLV